MTSPLRIGVLGLGTVGAALVQSLKFNAEGITTRAGRAISVTAVSARDRSRDRGIDLSSLKWFDDPVALAQSSEIDCLVELIGGADGVAKAAVEAALKIGSSGVAVLGLGTEVA